MPDADRLPGPGMRDKALMLAATLARMGVGLLTFMILARTLGPAAFGVFAAATAYATLVALVTDYGLATSALRLAAADPMRSGSIVGNALWTKAALATLALPIGTALTIAFVPGHDVTVYLLVFVGTLAYSFADLMLVAARAHRRFATEARLVVSTSIVILAVTTTVAVETMNLLATAAAFALTRLAYLAAVHVSLRALLRRDHRPSAQDVRGTLRRSAPYAADNMLTVLTGQVDILLLALLLSAHDLGIYQAGGRLVQVIVPFAVMLSTVHLPGLSASAVRDDGEAFHTQSRRITMEFAVLGLAGGFSFALLGPLVTRHFYGPAFDPLLPLWPGFAAYVLLRFTAAGFGIQLAALGRITPRIIVQIATLFCYTIAVVALVPGYGLGVTAGALTATGGVTFVGLGAILWRSGRADRSMAVALIVVPVVAVGLAWGAWVGG